MKNEKSYEPVNISKPNILIVLRVINALGYGLGPFLFDEVGQPTFLGHNVKVAGYPSFVVKDEVICGGVSQYFLSVANRKALEDSVKSLPSRPSPSIYLLVS